jgi:hypothetical protein
VMLYGVILAIADYVIFRETTRNSHCPECRNRKLVRWFTDS